MHEVTSLTRVGVSSGISSLNAPGKIIFFDISLPAWKTFGLASVAQFPWRLLTLTMVSFSIVGGAVMLLPMALMGFVLNKKFVFHAP
mgnify:CR=1 FL=1